jgi:hypothetical protein
VVKQAQKPSGWRNRITGHGEVDPTTLLAHPFNWRTHTRAQRDALEAAIDEVGFVQSVIVNTTTGYVVDGHLRVDLAMQREEPLIAVAYVSLTEAEERLILATLDPLAGMAVTDEDILAELIADIAFPEGALAEYLSLMSEDYGITPPDFQPVGLDEQGQLDKKALIECPECGHEFTR